MNAGSPIALVHRIPPARLRVRAAMVAWHDGDGSIDSPRPLTASTHAIVASPSRTDAVPPTPPPPPLTPSSHRRPRPSLPRLTPPCIADPRNAAQHNSNPNSTHCNRVRPRVPVRTCTHDAST
jgi:hypothetical protein